MAGLTIVKAVQTCRACPSQWDAWDTDGNYWYLRYRFSHGTAEQQPGPDFETWARKEPEIEFSTDRGPYDGTIELEEFCELASIRLQR
jgi:hypothetical protein